MDEWMGGLFLLILWLTQPSLAGVRARAELAKQTVDE